MWTHSSWTSRNGALTLVVILVANTLLIAAPAVLIAGWEPALQPAIVLPIALLSVAALLEVCAADSQRNLLTRDSRESKAAFRGNLVQGALLLGHFQISTVVATQATTVPEGAVSLSGLALMTAGIALRIWAIRELGPGFTDFFSSVPGPRVTSGPFRLVRHPAELGLLLIAAGFPIALGAISMLLVSLPLLVIVSAIRIRREESAMRQG